MARNTGNDFLQLERWQQALGASLALFILIGITLWSAGAFGERIEGPEAKVGEPTTLTQQEKLEILTRLEASNAESGMSEADKVEVLEKLERGEVGSE